MEPLHPRRRRARTSGVTLVEMLAATVILVVIVGIIFSLTQEASQAWKNTSGKIEVFRAARSAFEAMTRTISQATLNTYYDYDNASSPTTYVRQSDLQFVCGQGSTLLTGITPNSAVTHAIFFQAPLGVVSTSGYSNLGSLLSACGFYVMYGAESAKPGFLPATSRYRYRLMQFTQPAENLSIFAGNKGTSNWYLPAIVSDVSASPPTADFALADNVIALVILPRLSTRDEVAAESSYPIDTTSTPLGTALAPLYAFDSNTIGQGGTLTGGLSKFPALNSLNQLPPIVQVTMVAIDEPSAAKLGNSSSPPNAKLGLTASLFTQAKNFQTDMTSLQGALNAAHINFRVFQTDVAIRGAKWTTGN